MSVPVRYSAAAANYAAVVASGLSNTLTQEEQYHQQQQQQLQPSQQQQQQQHVQLQQQYQHQQLQQHQQQQQPQQQQQFEAAGDLYCGGGVVEVEQQKKQQLMQQRSSSMSSSSSSSVMPHLGLLPITNKTKSNNINNTNNKKKFHHNNNKNKNHHNNKQHNKTKMLSAAGGGGGGGGTGNGGSNNNNGNNKTLVVAAATVNHTAMMMECAEQPMLLESKSVVGCAANGGNNHVGNNVEMRTDWMRMSDEGRFGTPGAAGLEYQKYELQQQQQQQETPKNDDHPMEPSSDNEMMNNNNNSNTNNNTNIDNNNNNNNNNCTTATENNSNGSNNNNNNSLENELIAMSSDELFNTLKEYDVLQDKYHTVLLLPKESRREVTAGGRDGSAYVLRCLKMWYELPSDVLFSAMSLVDRFLDRMAVKPKHMACMSVASFHLAIKQLALKPIPPEDLVTISQCGCTAGDLERMTGVIANKLGVQMGHAPITSVSYLRIYYALFRNLAKEIGGQFFEFYQQLIKLEELENRLEILLCDVKTTVITPSTLALVLICLHLDFHIKESYTKGSPELKHVFDYILFLQEFMRIPDRVFTCGFSIVSGILSHYNGQNKAPYKQRLVWKLSSRTLRVLRPTNRFSSDLPTIMEGISNTMEDDDDGCRSRTESISSEEEEDWPTSAIIPIFEQC